MRWWGGGKLLGTAAIDAAITSTPSPLYYVFPLQTAHEVVVDTLLRHCSRRLDPRTRQWSPGPSRQ